MPREPQCYDGPRLRVTGESLPAFGSPAASRVSESGASIVAQRALDAEEQQQTILRLKQLCTLACFVWPVFLVQDWFMCRSYGDGRYLPFVLLRGIGEVLLVALWVRLSVFGRFQPRPWELKAFEVTIYTALCELISLMCLSLGGLGSPYGAGTSVVILTRVLISIEPWKRGAWSVIPPVLTYPLTMAFALALRPDIATTVNDRSLSTAALHMTNFLTTAMFVVASGHLTWSLRQRLFKDRLLGRYRLKRRLAVGGMGEVWVAWHPGLKRDVAVKVLRSQIGDAVALRRFELEVKATSELTHPNTIRIFDFGQTDDGVWFYVMELLEGMDLESLVRAVGPLSPGRAVRLIDQAARALAEAHDRGILHRDIKPHNIFSCSVGGEVDYVKLLDFGIARSLDAPAEAHLTATGMVAGTPKYMAPEVSLGQKATPASDVYALGAVLYFLLTGRAPFDLDNASALLIAQQNQDVESPSRIRGEALPAELEALVVKSLDRDPARRYLDAAALVQALAALPPLPREAKPLLPFQAYEGTARDPHAAPTLAETAATKAIRR